MGILLIERNGQRMVYMPEDDGCIYCEYKSTGSLGEECWKLLRKIPPAVGGLHGQDLRPNVMIDFLLELYKENIPAQAQQHIVLSMEYRRLEINP
jgi:hypothetical protein